MQGGEGGKSRGAISFILIVFPYTTGCEQLSPNTLKLDFQRMFLQYLWAGCLAILGQVMYSNRELLNWTWTCTDAGKCTIGASMCNSIDTGACTGRLALTLALRGTVVANGPVTLF